MNFSQSYLDEARQIIDLLDVGAIDAVVAVLADVRSSGGRVFLIGVGGSAANSSHAATDFRKIADIEAYAPVDNVSELTARANDEGWDAIFANWLKASRLRPHDAIFVLSVGGGSLEPSVSPNLVRAIQFARAVGARVVGIVGRDGGFTRQVADACIVIPTVNHERITPHSEAFQAVLWHLLVSHPTLKTAETRWESLK